MNATTVGAEAHIRSIREQLRDIRNALVLAGALKRTLAIPRATCHCDVASMDNIMAAGCRFPGSNQVIDDKDVRADFVPFACPLDHIMDTAMATGPLALERGIHIRPLDPAGEAPDAVLDAAPLEAAGKLPLQPGDLLRTLSAAVKVTAGADSAKLLDVTPWIAILDGLRPLVVPDDVAADQRGSARKLADWAATHADFVVSTNNWCTECFPKPCHEWFPPGVLDEFAGRIHPTRETEELVCIDLMTDAVGKTPITSRP